MAKHYGYNIWEVSLLTFAQLGQYLDNLDYVLEMSKKLGEAPEIHPPSHELIDFARRCGITVPYDVHYDMIISGIEL